MILSEFCFSNLLTVGFSYGLLLVSMRFYSETITRFISVKCILHHCSNILTVFYMENYFSTSIEACLYTFWENPLLKSVGVGTIFLPAGLNLEYSKEPSFAPMT